MAVSVPALWLLGFINPRQEECGPPSATLERLVLLRNGGSQATPTAPAESALISAALEVGRSSQDPLRALLFSNIWGALLPVKKSRYRLLYKCSLNGDQAS